MIQTFRRTGHFSDRVLRLLNQTQQSAQRHFKVLRRNKEGKQMVKRRQANGQITGRIDMPGTRRKPPVETVKSQTALSASFILINHYSI